MKPTKFSLSGYKGIKTNIWVSQATQPSHQIVGFHILFTINPTFTLRTIQANRLVYETIHSQSISLFSLSGYLSKSAFIVGFIRLSSQRLLTRSNATRHSQVSRWVYQATIKAIFLVGFIKLLRKLAGRTTNLVSSYIELRRPSQYLSGLASPLPTHPTQRSVPFSVPLSLRVHLPF